MRARIRPKLLFAVSLVALFSARSATTCGTAVVQLTPMDLMLLLALSFGLLVVTHVALSAGLLSRVSPGHGVLARE